MHCPASHNELRTPHSPLTVHDTPSRIRHDSSENKHSYSSNCSSSCCCSSSCHCCISVAQNWSWNRWTKGPKIEAENRQRGYGSCGEGSEPPPHRLGRLWGSAVSSPSGVRVEPANCKQKCSMTANARRRQTRLTKSAFLQYDTIRYDTIRYDR